MDITLHIGAHRTATTTLQTCLMRNQGSMAAAGLAFWGPCHTRAGLFDGLICNPEYAGLRTDQQALRSATAIRAKIAQLHQSGTRRLIISEENMIGTQRDNMLYERLYLHAEDRLARFGPVFAGHRLRIAISVRAQPSYWASLLNFCVLRGIQVPLGTDLDRLVTQPRRWPDLVLAVARVFPGAEIFVWPFEAFGHRPELQFDFLTGVPDICGLRHRKHWNNASPSRDKLRECLATSGANPDWIAPGAGRWQPFSADQAAAMQADYTDDLAWFQSRGDGAMTYMPDIRAHGRWQREERGRNHGGWETQVG